MSCDKRGSTGLFGRIRAQPAGGGPWKMNGLLQISVISLALCCATHQVLAEEPPPAAGAEGSPAQQEATVSFATQGDFFLGYRWVSTEDAFKAAEYIYPHSSATFGLDLLSCPLPYRYHVNAEFLSNYDFYTDAGFAYQDLLLFRDILVGVHHNLEHYDYQFAGEPPGLVYLDREPGEDYYADFVSNLLSLRIKAPDYPFHIFLKDRHVGRDGLIDQRFLLGDFDHTYKISEERDIDWSQDAYTLGTNSHLGPIEIEYDYDHAGFNAGARDILYDVYPATVDLTRPADLYPHNVLAETESSAHTVKIHSSYTGGLVAAATLGNLYQKNNYSGVESTTWKGAFDCSWIPDPAVGLFFRYRHRDLDLDTPRTTTLVGLASALTYPVRQGISYDQDSFNLSVRFKPMRRMTLLAVYDYSRLDRSNVDQWTLVPDQTDIHTISFTANANPLDKLKVKASYEYKNYSQPAYNNTPDSASRLRLTTTYTPLFWLNVYLEYLLSVTERDSLNYLNDAPYLLLENGERDGRNDHILASVTTRLSPRMSLTASWYYQREHVKQDLAFGKWLTTDVGDLPYFDSGVPYADTSNSFSLGSLYLPSEELSLSADVTYTITKGSTGYDDVVGGAPFSLASFSAIKSSETIFSLEVAKQLSRQWEIRLRSYLDIYNDRESGLLDGNVITTTLGLKRYF